MPKKPLPYMFLAFLTCILLFILGVRYGQRVEQINKTTQLLISPAPSLAASPTTVPLAFSSYTHASCGASLLLPSQLIKTQESSTSAVFSTEKKQLALALSCEKGPFIQGKGEKAVTINTIRAYETATKDTTAYRFYNPKNAKVVTVTAAAQFLPLLEKTLSF